MNDAHCDSIAILGECLASKGPFDFSKQVRKWINNFELWSSRVSRNVSMNLSLWCWTIDLQLLPMKSTLYTESVSKLSNFSLINADHKIFKCLGHFYLHQNLKLRCHVERYSTKFTIIIISMLVTRVTNKQNR